MLAQMLSSSPDLSNRIEKPFYESVAFLENKMAAAAVSDSKQADATPIFWDLERADKKGLEFHGDPPASISVIAKDNTWHAAKTKQS